MRVFKYIVLSIYIFLVIFILANAYTPGDKSATESDKVTEVVIEVADAVSPSNESITDKYGLDQIKHFVRKAFGHFGLFFVCSIFGTMTYIFFIKKKYIGIITSILTGITIAGTSEFLQSLVPDRGPSFKDVLIDSGGYLSGLLLVGLIMLIVYLVRRKKTCKEMTQD